MLKRVEILIDEELLHEVIRKYHLADAREAVHVALRALVDEADNEAEEPQEDDYDEFSDLKAWRLHPSNETG
jgi:Arc/MetJ family transcription regulator